MIPRESTELAEFQLQIATRWKRRAADATDPFARFFFLFAGFNALYYLWTQIDGPPAGGEPQEKLSDRQTPNESRQIEHLLQRAGGVSGSVLYCARASVDFFRSRRAIERMDRREPGKPRVGKPREGRSARNKLNAEDENEQLCGLGTLLYLVRCNLAHGSKIDQGDDQEVIEHAVPGLEAILGRAIDFTRSELREACRA